MLQSSSCHSVCSWFSCPHIKTFNEKLVTVELPRSWKSPLIYPWSLGLFLSFSFLLQTLAMPTFTILYWVREGSHLTKMLYMQPPQPCEHVAVSLSHTLCSTGIASIDVFTPFAMEYIKAHSCHRPVSEP